MTKPLSVAIAALIHDNKILLIQRERGDYQGMWGLPGGKIELDEHVSDAVVREIKEETGIETEFISHCGIVSEHMKENGEVAKHFMLHVCELHPQTTTIVESNEGTSRWFLLSELDKHPIIPSDLLMIQKIVLEKEGSYYNCVITKKGDTHVLEKFEKL